MTNTDGRPGTIDVVDHGEALSFSFTDMMKYHGPDAPGGVAHAFKVMERVLPLLDDHGPPERRDITIHTAFGGPGARDAFELVTRAVTEDRYDVDPVLERPERGRTLERYVFSLGYRGRTVTVQIRQGLVVDEFVVLAQKDDRTPEEERRLTVLKQEMADRLMARPASEVYDIDRGAD